MRCRRRHVYCLSLAIAVGFWWLFLSICWLLLVACWLFVVVAWLWVINYKVPVFVLCSKQSCVGSNGLFGTGNDDGEKTTRAQQILIEKPLSQKPLPANTPWGNRQPSSASCCCSHACRGKLANLEAGRCHWVGIEGTSSAWPEQVEATHKPTVLLMLLRRGARDYEKVL